jgi:integration host factor subunit beta
MNKSDLILDLAQKCHIPPKVAAEVVDLFFGSMAEALRQGDRVEIRGFGSFVSKRYGAYEGRNPKTGAKIIVPEKRLPFFKVGKELRRKVDQANGAAGDEGPWPNGAA